jgi:hypothetical protein
MSALCIAIAAAAGAVVLPSPRLTLAWTHSVERTAWEEDYVIAGDRLRVDQARIRRSGAGMEPGTDATWRDGWWRYRPQISDLSEVTLANSSDARGYTVCWDGSCHLLDAFVRKGEAATLIVLPCVAGSGL